MGTTNRPPGEVKSPGPSREENLRWKGPLLEKGKCDPEWEGVKKINGRGKRGGETGDVADRGVHEGELQRET